jgi:hypothetical protein
LISKEDSPGGYDSKHERPGWQISGDTGWSSAPTSVRVRLHQQWQEQLCVSVEADKASATCAGMNIFLVRNCLQTVVFMFITP